VKKRLFSWKKIIFLSEFYGFLASKHFYYFVLLKKRVVFIFLLFLKMILKILHIFVNF